MSEYEVACIRDVIEEYNIKLKEYFNFGNTAVFTCSRDKEFDINISKMRDGNFLLDTDDLHLEGYTEYLGYSHYSFDELLEEIREILSRVTF